MKKFSYYFIKSVEIFLRKLYYSIVNMNKTSYSQNNHLKNRQKERDMPLVFAPIGKDLRIVKIMSDDKTKKHLESLGITIDSTISIISQSGGSVICLIKDGRLALDKEMATKILVA